MQLTIEMMVTEAHQEFMSGSSIEEAISATIVAHIPELYADGCQLTVDLMPEEAAKPTDLWFVTNPVYYIRLNLHPHIEAGLLALPGVDAELQRRSQRSTDRNRFKYRPPAAP